MVSKKPPITILGAGSWGTALALVLARNGEETRLWSPDAAHIHEMRQSEINTRYLPNSPFPKKHLSVYDDLATGLIGVRDIIIVVPSVAFQTVLLTLKPHVFPDTRIAWGTKGLSQNAQLLHESIANTLPPDRAMAILSGPSLAQEVAAGLPTAVSIASNRSDFSLDLRKRFHSPHFRVYQNDDLIGVELCGAVKNTFAIATGLSDSLGLGANARSALITRGLKEMTRLCQAVGGKSETCMGLAGVGDLVLTCTDAKSRNYRFGQLLGAGNTIKNAKKEIGQAVEGLHNTPLILKLAKKLSVDTPIIQTVYRILYEALSPKVAVQELLERSPKSETAS